MKTIGIVINRSDKTSYGRYLRLYNFDHRIEPLTHDLNLIYLKHDKSRAGLIKEICHKIENK